MELERSGSYFRLNLGSHEVLGTGRLEVIQDDRVITILDLPDQALVDQRLKAKVLRDMLPRLKRGTFVLGVDVTDQSSGETSFQHFTLGYPDMTILPTIQPSETSPETGHVEQPPATSDSPAEQPALAAPAASAPAPQPAPAPAVAPTPRPAPAAAPVAQPTVAPVASAPAPVTAPAQSVPQPAAVPVIPAPAQATPAQTRPASTPRPTPPAPARAPAPVQQPPQPTPAPAPRQAPVVQAPAQPAAPVAPAPRLAAPAPAPAVAPISRPVPAAAPVAQPTVAPVASVQTPIAPAQPVASVQPTPVRQPKGQMWIAVAAVSVVILLILGSVLAKKASPGSSTEIKDQSELVKAMSRQMEALERRLAQFESDNDNNGTNGPSPTHLRPVPPANKVTVANATVSGSVIATDHATVVWTPSVPVIDLDLKPGQTEAQTNYFTVTSRSPVDVHCSDHIVSWVDNPGIVDLYIDGTRTDWAPSEDSPPTRGSNFRYMIKPDHPGMVGKIMLVVTPRRSP